MKRTPIPTPKKTTKGHAIPVRFDASDLAILTALTTRTGLSTADVIRRAVRFAGPKFRTGEVNIADLCATPA